MTISVEGPDGAIHEFPDGISQDVIKGAMAKHYGSPTPTNAPVDKQKNTEELPLATKALKALAFGAAETRTKDANTLRKSGALGFNPDQIDKNTEWLKQQAGLENYDPASAHFADSSKPWTERIGYLPRTLLEGVPTMAQHIAASSVAGPLGMLGSTALSEGGSSVDRVREADKTDPNAELTPEQKLRVGGNVALQAVLNEIGGRATLGASTPVKKVGMEGVKQAAGNVTKAAAIDAGVGGYGAGADKAIIEGQVPSVADVALPALAGAAVGTAFRGPGAARDAAVATRFRELGKIDPQSRGEVANLLQHYDGNFDATREHLGKELDYASKGLDDITKEAITGAKIKIKHGQRLEPEEIQAVAKADPEAGKVLQNLDTFSVMKGMDNGGLSGSMVGRLLNPFQRAAHGDVPTTLGRFAEGASIGHAFWAHDPTTAAAVLGGQAAGTLALKGADAFTGAANPAKVITDKFAGSAAPTPTIAQARAAAFAKDLAERQAKAEAAKGELTKAEAEKAALNEAEANRKAAEKAAKEKARADAAAMKIARDSLNARRNSDAMQERYKQEKIGNFQDTASDMLGGLDKLEREESRAAAEKQKVEDEAVRRQANLMRNSQAEEERRVAAEASAQAKLLRQQRSNLAIRERSDIPMSEALGRDLGDSQNVPLQELVSSSASPAIKTALGVRRIVNQAEKKYWAEQRNKLAIRNNSDIPASEYLGQDLGVDQNVPLPSMVSTSAALPLALSRMKNPDAAKQLRNSFKSSEETGDLDVSNLGDANSTPITVRPAEVTAKMTMDKVSKKAKESAEKKTAKEQQAKDDAAKAKAEKKVAEATVKAKEAERDADANLYLFEHRGQKVRVPKELVGNPRTYLQSFKEKTDRRLNVIDGAKALTKSAEVKKLLDTLANDWTDTTNNPDLAYGHLERIVNKSNMPKNVADYLLDNWDSIEGTWATARRDIEND